MWPAVGAGLVLAAAGHVGFGRHEDDEEKQDNGGGEHGEVVQTGGGETVMVSRLSNHTHRCARLSRPI